MYQGNMLGGTISMFKLYASGDSDQLSIFLTDLKSNPRYDVALEAKEHYDKEQSRGKMVMNVDVKSVAITTVILETKNGIDVEINLLHGVIVELDDGITNISGKVFDVFA